MKNSCMVGVFPFSAVRYVSESVGDLGNVIAPPYDQISETLQNELYDRHPYNFVRLIFGKILDGDSERENRYTRAFGDLNLWIQKGILKKDVRPWFFAYEQKFALNAETFSRCGIVALMRLEPLGKGVLPHEKTFPKPKADRLNLMRACKANLEHVFFLYDDPQDRMESLLVHARKGEPLLLCKDNAGTQHALWPIESKYEQEQIIRFFRDRQLFIADGHHRYETSLAYQKEMQDISRGGTGDEAPFHFRLGTFVSLQNKGLLILPTHRVVRNLSAEQSQTLQRRLENYFAMEEMPNLELLLEKMSGNRKRHVFGFALEGKLYMLTLKEGFDSAREFFDTASPLRDLDVFLLHSLILDRLLCLPSDRLDEFIEYVRWPQDALLRSKESESSAVFFLNPAKPEQVKQVAQAGETMPHKSTDFYPKLWSGLVFYKMEF